MVIQGAWYQISAGSMLAKNVKQVLADMPGIVAGSCNLGSWSRPVAGGILVVAASEIGEELITQSLYVIGQPCALPEARKDALPHCLFILAGDA